MNGLSWYRDGQALSLILLGFLPWLAGLNLAWETVQLPLYTLWREATTGYIAFSVVHCTLGDLAIGLSAFILALVVTRSRGPASWPWARIALLTTGIAITYTAFSEWMNTVALQSWKYSELMPVVAALGVELGLSPLLQWLLIPPLALALTRRRALRHRRTAAASA